MEAPPSYEDAIWKETDDQVNYSLDFVEFTKG